MAGEPDPPMLSHSMAVVVQMSSDAAESVASTFERVAATYRRMADGPRGPHASARLLAHAAHLEERAEVERAAAARLRRMLEREALFPPKA